MGFSSYEEYRESVPDEGKTILDEIKDIGLSLVPNGDLTINYGVPTIKLGKKNVFHFGAFKEHWSFFPGSSVIEVFKDKLEGYKVSKGTIKVPYGRDIDVSLFKDMILARLKEIEGFIVIGSLIKKPIDVVWNAFISEADIVNWNYASADWFCPEAKNDFRVGGVFNYRMEARDGSFGFDFSGEYVDIREKEFISYVLGDGRRVEVSFRSIDEGTWLEEAFIPEKENSLDMQRVGWSNILENFRKYMENK